MKASAGALPHIWINHFVAQELNKYEDCGVTLASGSNIIPFFPSAPTNVEQVYQDLLINTGDQNPLLISYDRMLRFRPSPLYVHKREQLMYYLYNGSVDTLFNAGNIISQLLDREDVAAQELNKWMYEKQASANPITDFSTKIALDKNIFFRNIKVYQADEGRDLLELGTVKTVYTNKYIIEYDYHIKTAMINNPNYDPDLPESSKNKPLIPDPSGLYT